MARTEEKARRDLLDRLIVAICADFARRQEAIESRSVGRRVRMEYAYMNSRVLDGAGEISGGALAKTFIDEIGSGTGYAGSKLCGMGESTYKTYKKEIKENIAKKLSLMD